MRAQDMRRMHLQRQRMASGCTVSFPLTPPSFDTRTSVLLSLPAGPDPSPTRSSSPVWGAATCSLAAGVAAELEKGAAIEGAGLVEPAETTRHVVPG